MVTVNRNGWSHFTGMAGHGWPEYAQIERLVQRYRFASEYCKGKDVLEVACGGGIGLGYLARRARKVVGGDIDEKVLEFARRNYGNRRNIELRTLDAQQLPFADKSFDVRLADL